MATHRLRRKSRRRWREVRADGSPPGPVCMVHCTLSFSLHAMSGHSMADCDAWRPKSMFDLYYKLQKIVARTEWSVLRTHPSPSQSHAFIIEAAVGRAVCFVVPAWHIVLTRTVRVQRAQHPTCSVQHGWTGRHCLLVSRPVCELAPSRIFGVSGRWHVVDALCCVLHDCVVSVAGTHLPTRCNGRCRYGQDFLS
jgi:hypothetical protein